MTETSFAEVSVALEKREAFIRENIETLSVKRVTRLLEEDLGLPTKSLSRFKEKLGERITKIVEGIGGGNGAPKNRETENEENFEEEEDEVAVAVKKRQPQSDKGQKRKSPVEKKSQASTKKARVSVTKESKPKAPGDRVIDRLKKILKEATVKIPPNIYRNRDPESLTAALTQLAGKNGLSLKSTREEIAGVRDHLEKTRDLEGIDTSNIVTATGRRPRRAAAAMVSYNLDSDIKRDGSGTGQENASKKASMQRSNPKKNVLQDSSEDDPIGTEDDEIDGGPPSNGDNNGRVPSKGKRRTKSLESDVEEDGDAKSVEEKKEGEEEEEGNKSSQSEDSGDSDGEASDDDEGSDFEGEDCEDSED